LIDETEAVTAAAVGGDTPLKAWMRALAMTAPIADNPSRTLPLVIDELADRFGIAPALLSEFECLSYRALAQRAHRYARWALAHGITAGKVVCLMMPNCPDYMAIWLGITRVGGVVALVNTNLADALLIHSIDVVAPQHLIVGAKLRATVVAVLPRLASRPQCWVHGDSNGDLPRVDEQAERFSGDRLDAADCPLPTLHDRALYIYTSGTTGLPKAANVSHFRLMQWSHWFAGMMNTSADDVMYNCLPMYHSIGGGVATGAVLVGGGAVLLRERFSASRFWDDIVEGQCTLFQYIGELCRYLVISPPHPREAQHLLRLCCGNGLRPDVWKRFQDRFHIPRVLEFYAATEGNFSLYNCEGRIGAIGRIPPFLAHRFPVALVKLDDESGEPVRNDAGFCIRCGGDEAGEAIGRIGDDAKSAGGRFEGYSDEAASQQKILRDVFARGDLWFRTGDLMRRDGQGFFYFVDRLGDTFRWRGENVSTTEAAEAIASCPAVTQAVVYGVKVPGTEGRAGMAALTVSDDFDLAVLHHHLAVRLPDYARPLFVRIQTEIAATGTFKPNKQQLARDGYDPTVTAEPIYFNDRSRQALIKLDTALYELIQTSQMRL
jgi:fatty-acyl-CoA synthase